MKLKRLSILRLSQPKTYSSSKSSTTKKKKRVKEVADSEVSPSSSFEKQSSANENSNSKSIINNMDMNTTPTPTTSNTNTTPPLSSSIISSRFHLQNAQVPQRKALIIHHSNSPKPSKETLSKYGKITQYSVSSNSSIYVAYSSEKNAQYAKRELSVSQKDVRVEEAVLKYCQHFLRGQDCKDLNCLYLHEEICRSCSPQKKQKQNNKPLSSVKTHAQQQTEVINSFVLEQSSISLGNINNDSDKSVSRKLFPTNSSFDRSIGPPNKDKTTVASFSDNKTIHSPWQICSPIMIIQEQRQDNTLNKNQKGTPVINKREQPPPTPIPTPTPTPVSKSKEVTESTRKKKQLNERYNSTMMSPSHTYNNNNLNQTQQILHHHHHPHHHMNSHKPVSYPHHPHTHSRTTYWNTNTNTTRQQYPQQGYYHHNHRQSYHATQHAACYYNTNNTSTRGAGGGYHTVYQTQQPQPQPQQQWR